MIKSFQQFNEEASRPEELTDIEYVDVSHLGGKKSQLENELSFFRNRGMECNFEDKDGNACTADNGVKLYISGADQLDAKTQHEVMNLFKSYNCIK